MLVEIVRSISTSITRLRTEKTAKQAFLCYRYIYAQQHPSIHEVACIASIHYYLITFTTNHVFSSSNYLLAYCRNELSSGANDVLSTDSPTGSFARQPWPVRYQLVNFLTGLYSFHFASLYLFIVCQQSCGFCQKCSQGTNEVEAPGAK